MGYYTNNSGGGSKNRDPKITQVWKNIRHLLRWKALQLWGILPTCNTRGGKASRSPEVGKRRETKTYGRTNGWTYKCINEHTWNVWTTVWLFPVGNMLEQSTNSDMAVAQNPSIRTFCTTQDLCVTHSNPDTLAPTSQKRTEETPWGC